MTVESIMAGLSGVQPGQVWVTAFCGVGYEVRVAERNGRSIFHLYFIDSIGRPYYRRCYKTMGGRCSVPRRQTQGVVLMRQHDFPPWTSAPLSP